MLKIWPGLENTMVAEDLWIFCLTLEKFTLATNKTTKSESSLMKIALLLIALWVLCSGSSCLDNQTVLTGQLGQITDVQALPCVPYPTQAETHACLLLSNPYQGTIKIFDASDNQFVLSPIGYFSLVIEVGQSPYQMAVINHRIFTLDPIAQAIYEVPSHFISPITKPLKKLDFSPQLFALATNTEGQIIAYVSQTGSLSQLSLETDSPPVSLPLSGEITQLQVTPDQKYLLVGIEKQLFILDPQSTDTLHTVSLTASITSMSSDATQILLGLSDKTLVVLDLQTGRTQIQSPALEEVASAVYLPSTLSGTPSTCCNGEPNWVAALLMNGKLQYWPYANQQFKAPQNIDIALTTGVADFTLTNPLGLVGVSVNHPKQDGLSCERRLFLVYEGIILNTCEGSSGLKRVDQMEY